MAIIYTYNTALPALDDILLGTEKDATLRNPTKNFKISDLAKFIIDTVSGTNLTIPLFFDVTDPITGLVQTTLVDSIMTQDVNPNGTTLTIAGNISITGTIADSTGATGTANQVLTSTVTGTAWSDFVLSTGEYPFVAGAVAPFVITINHPGTWGDYPSVTVVTNNKTVVIGEVTYITTTQLTLTFTATFSGIAYLN
jgi:hypothetical protein